MDIEKVAAEQPDKVLVLPLPIEGAFRSYHLIRTWLTSWDGKEFANKSGTLIVKALVKAFKET